MFFIFFKRAQHPASGSISTFAVIALLVMSASLAGEPPVTNGNARNLASELVKRTNVMLLKTEKDTPGMSVCKC